MTVTPRPLRPSPDGVGRGVTTLFTVEAGSLATTPQPLVFADLCSGSPGALTATASANVTSGAAPLTVQFTGTASGGTPPYAYAWTFGDNSVPSSAPNPTHTYTQPGTYSVTLQVTDSTGATSTDSHLSIAVTGSPTLGVTASASATSASVGSAITFSAQVSGGTAPYSYAWNFGDGGTSTAASPSHSYSQPGHYTVSVRVTDASGTSAMSAPLSVTITPVPPQIATISHAGPPFRLIVTGSHFESGATATIGTTPWTNVVVKNSTKLVIKGGKSLKALLPLGQPVPIVVTNSDGGTSAPYLFTR